MSESSAPAAPAAPADHPDMFRFGPAAVLRTGTVSIVAVYCGPTNARGSSYRVHRGDTNWLGDPDRLRVSYQEALDLAGNRSHADAATGAILAYLARKDDGWNNSVWHTGATDTGAVAVRGTWRSER